MALSGKQQELFSGVERLMAERDALRQKNDALGMRIFEMLCEKERAQAVRVVACDVLSANAVRKAAGMLCEGARMGLVLAARDEGWSFALSSQTEDMRPVTKALCAAFGGKGGGPKDMTQGVLAGGTEEEIRKAITAL